MTFNRRQFLGSALPLVALGSSADASTSELTSVSSSASYYAESSATSTTDPNTQVWLAGDSLPYPAESEATRLQALLLKHRTNPGFSAGSYMDSYLSGGAVSALEEKFSSLLGKESSVFMPTGTMANHIAIRLLCGEAKHALVQQESHVYRDESNCVTTLSGINLVPLAAGKTAPTLSELNEAIQRAEIGPYPIKVGAISLESPVRRTQGGTLSIEQISEIAKIARAKQIPLHLDGARLLLMCGVPGFELKSYCQFFDTVYVSLYKYLGSPYGAILSGTKIQMNKARELRHILGGTQSSGWHAALPALDALEGVEQRFASVRQAGEALLSTLEKIDGIKVHRVEQGSNIATLAFSPARLAGLEQRLKDANIKARKVLDGKMSLQFNESILRRDTAYLVAALAGIN
ncbi:threonine aldolase family protein [Undibacterium flavidum]|uniref:Amino acid lyase n=1 Tax=Undibacterium flavidum TaxID=2762297 RepID=A0ABR6Y7T8_9BURK|nr:beta-eliminating lyase-related protein [Undibacterium flavidum]MBC3872689.1 amino acid lyase [Undibacterium flavidum]